MFPCDPDWWLLSRLLPVNMDAVSQIGHEEEGRERNLRTNEIRSIMEGHHPSNVSRIYTYNFFFYVDNEV